MLIWEQATWHFQRDKGGWKFHQRAQGAFPRCRPGCLDSSIAPTLKTMSSPVTESCKQNTPPKISDGPLGES